MSQCYQRNQVPLAERERGKYKINHIFHLRNFFLLNYVKYYIIVNRRGTSFNFSFGLSMLENTEMIHKDLHLGKNLPRWERCFFTNQAIGEIPAGLGIQIILTSGRMASKTSPRNI